MAFTPREWKEKLAGGTAISAAALISLEERLAKWAEEVAEGKIAKSLVTAKGDLIAATAAATPARLAVGADKMILMADSTQTSGMKWVRAPIVGSVNGDATIKSGVGFTIEMKAAKGSYHVVLATPLGGKGSIAVTPLFDTGPAEGGTLIVGYGEEEEEGKKWHVYMAEPENTSLVEAPWEFTITPQY
jgi:hypothetical protein